MALSLLLCDIAYGQGFSVVGSVTDSSGAVLANASIAAIIRADSSLAGFSTSRKDGRFKIAHLKPNFYTLQVSFVGFEMLSHDVDIVNENADVGTLMLSMQINALEEFVVHEERLPFVIRGDTIEYNALAFMMRPHDMVEDLLRRLPGIDVSRNGTITAHGKVVENVLVEGKEFFGDNPAIATKNLPADAVDHVQVFDMPSDLSKLTGIPDGLEEKTINLELTQEAKRGFLGQATGGFGMEHSDWGLYSGEGALFRFAPRTQLAFVGGGENLNQNQFSYQQLRGFSDVRNLLGNTTATGYGELLGLGFNLNQEIASYTTINASYLLADEEKHKERRILRHQLVGSTESTYSDESSNQESMDLFHGIGLNAEIKLGDGHDMILQSDLTKSASTHNSKGLERLVDYSGMLQNSAMVLSDNSSDHLTGSLYLAVRKRISDSGRSLVLEAMAFAQNRDVTDDLYTDALLVIPDEIISQEKLHQLQKQHSNLFRHSQRLQLVQPLQSGQVLTSYIERFSRQQDSEKMFIDLARGQHLKIETLGDGLSEEHTYLSTGISYGWYAENRSWFISADLEAQHSKRKGITILMPDLEIRTSYTYLLPYLLAKKEIGQNGELDFFYRTSTREPTIRQLQPYLDNSNPLRTYQGNPLLTPEYHHDWNIQYRRDLSYSGLRLGVNMGISYTQNSIVLDRKVDLNSRQRIRDVNLDGAWSRDVGIGVGKYVYRLGLRWNLRWGIDVKRRLELINDVENTGTLRRNSLKLDLEYYRGDIFEVTTSGRVNWSQTNYSLNDEMNRNYVTGRVTIDISGYIRNAWLFSLSSHYRIYDRDIFEISRNIGLLDLSFSRFLLKGRGNIKLEIHDLLNQNDGIVFTNGATYIQESHTVSMGRYLILKFTYKPRLL
ncbi:MAG: TonB-dependent receptor [Bacteroidetes bacterium]|nr:TonB-dependent receptor [Bacteroidota bacterium]